MGGRVAVSAMFGIAIAALVAPAFAGGRKAAPAPRAAHANGPLQPLGVAAFKRKLAAVKGVGLVTKLKMAALIGRFTEDVYWFHEGKSRQTLAQLHTRFNALHHHIAGLIAADNPTLHAALIRSRAALWRAFADRARYRAGFGRKLVRRIEGHDPQLAANPSR